MTIQALGFVDTSMFTARFLLKYLDKANDGVLPLREIKDADAADLPILKEWNSARALLTKMRARGAAYFNGAAPDLGRAWVEVLPPGFGTPWVADAGDYADGHIRTRTCLVPSPAAISFAGTISAVLPVGVVHTVDHKALCSEVNHGDSRRVHLIVDFKIPVDAEP